MLSKEKKKYDKYDSDHFYRWGRGTRDARATQIGKHNSSGNLSESERLTLFGAVGFHDSLICQHLLCGISELFAPFKTFARKISQGLSKLRRKYANDWCNY